jgi:hypothetical protein
MHQPVGADQLYAAEEARLLNMISSLYEAEKPRSDAK